VSSVLRPHQHSIGYTGDNNGINSICVTAISTHNLTTEMHTVSSLETAEIK